MLGGILSMSIFTLATLANFVRFAVRERVWGVGIGGFSLIFSDFYVFYDFIFEMRYEKFLIENNIQKIKRSTNSIAQSACRVQF
jgi:hypothetical protein